MKKAFMIAIVGLPLAAIGLLARGYTAPSSSVQETISGDWTAKVKQADRGPVLWLSLNRNTDAGKGGFQMSSDFPLQDFTGLNPNADSNVQFTLQREAGVVLFDGLFKDGRGVGDFRFTPNNGFISTMRSLGYDELSVEKLFSMTMHDVGVKFINELRALGYDKVPVNKLIAMRIHGADGDFIRRMQAVGYKEIPADKLIAMRIHHVSGEFIKEMEGVGYSNIPLDKLIAMRIHSVDGKFVKEMKDQGFSNLSIDDLLKLRIHGVDSDYVRRMRGNR
jgi:hypothetical protein